MANIFTNAVKFLGATLKQTVTSDFLRDFTHANKLFVGENFELVPKSGYLFHVYLDLNPYLASSYLLDTKTLQEIGLMVKSAELPKYSIDNKLMNAYNRPNYIQSKIKYEPVTISFHDDSMNTIRNFWYDYYRYYYRDSDKSEQGYYLTYKYNSDPLGSFGFTRRTESTENFIKAIRIYSMSRSFYSEYILINPIITNFRHGEHDYSNTASSNLTNTMTIAYENVLYSDGAVSKETVKGFADLHYDRRPSPLNRVGNQRSIFGRNGLLNTAGSVISDLTQGNFLSAIFKTATARQTFKGVNIKKAAVNEIRQIYTQSATNIITGAITNAARQTVPGGRTVISPLSLDGVVKNAASGIARDASTLALIGATVAINSANKSNKYARNPVTAANKAATPSNYNPGFPTVPGATARPPAPTTMLRSNDSNLTQQATNQNNSSVSREAVQNEYNIKSYERRVQTLGNDAALSEKQIVQSDISIANLTAKLNLARSTSSPDVGTIAAQLDTALAQKQEHEQKLQALKQEIEQSKQRLNDFQIRQNNLGRNG